MMVVMKYLFFALILLKSVEAYVGILPEEEKPAKFADQEGCWISKYDRVLQVDVPFTPIDNSTCVKYTCKDNKQIFVEGCSKIGLTDNCEGIPPDFTKPFPECCRKARCNLPNGEVIVVEP